MNSNTNNTNNNYSKINIKNNSSRSIPCVSEEFIPPPPSSSSPPRGGASPSSSFSSSDNSINININNNNNNNNKNVGPTGMTSPNKKRQISLEVTPPDVVLVKQQHQPRIQQQNDINNNDNQQNDNNIIHQRGTEPSGSIISSEEGVGVTAATATAAATAISSSTTTTASSSNNNKNSNRDERTSKDYYFDSYAHHAIHEEMLKDEVRTRTYEMAIMQNKHLFKDKIILDVGCGTGILSMFAAKAGAKHVYGIDCSAIVDQAREIVNLNGFSNQITIIKGKVEEVELPVTEVDVIVSEWMGYFLLYESMLDTVLFARDKWLVKNNNGIIFPDKAIMYMCAVEDGDVKRDRLDFWSNVYGFDMSPIKKIALKEPVVDVVDAKAIVSDSVPILSLDILTCTKDDLNFDSSFQLNIERNDYVHGLVAYFECAFTQVHKPIGFSTAPFCRYTHWKQTIFYLEDSLVVCKDEKIDGTISCKPNSKNPRDLDIGMSLDFHGRHSNINKHIHYRLR